MRIRAFIAATSLSLCGAAVMAQQDMSTASDGGGGNGSQTPTVVTITAAPPTTIEAVEQQVGAVITKRFTKGAVIASDDGGSINLYAALVTGGNPSSVTAIAVELVQRGGRVARAYIDADEIDALLSGLNELAKIDRAEGVLDGVEARYTTRGHLQFVNVDDGGSRAVVIHVLQVAPVTGQVSVASLRVRAGRIAEIRQQIAAAKELLARESK